MFDDFEIGPQSDEYIPYTITDEFWDEIRSAIAERLDSRMVDSLDEYFREVSNIPY